MEPKILKGEIPLNEASQMTANWRSFNSSETLNGYSMDQIMPNAYTISVEDLRKLSEEPGVNSIRIYFGYEQNEPTPMAGDHFAMKIMMVGVDSDGKDIILDGDRSGIYDQFVPCPSTCDSSSPLS